MGDTRHLTIDELYDLVHEVRQENPYDGRMARGRGYLDGAWAVMKKAYDLADKKEAS